MNPPNLNHLLNTPPAAFPYKILHATTNNFNRITFALIRIKRQTFYLTRCYNPNGSCYFHLETP